MNAENLEQRAGLPLRTIARTKLIGSRLPRNIELATNSGCVFDKLLEGILPEIVGGGPDATGIANTGRRRKRLPDLREGCLY